ncbi:hypothetical protein [Sphingobacterium multivorum]|uniref:hypothetical protein n=1 Tax=Sphingobacterium multivorum TaxID=28454 RepID=UPI0028ADF7B1|nr:hypothetical protein [Sphingobacterium multivorum]
MSDGQLDIEFRFNTPEAKRDAQEVRDAAAQVNATAQSGNNTLNQREGLLQRLKRRLAELNVEQDKASSISQLAALNKQYASLENDIMRLNQVGKAGFDAQGNAMISNMGILQRLQQSAALWERGMLEATNPAALEKYSQKLALVNAEIARLTKGANIGGGWNGLQNSINQLSRELPAFTFSLQTGFMAISNNIPMLADEIGKLKKQNAELVASGQKGVPVWKQLATSLFSWQTAMSVGITLLTVYGKEIANWISSLIKGKAAIDIAKKSFETLNKAIEDNSFATAVQDISRLRNAVDMAKQGFVSKKSVVEEYNKTIGRTTGQVKNLDEVERFLINNADNYVRMMMYKAAANLALADAAKEAVEAEKTRIKELSEFTNNFLDAPLQARSAEQYKAQQAQLLRNQKERKDKEVKIHEDAEQKQLGISNKFMRKAQEYASKMNLSVFGNDPEKPKDTSKQEENLYKQILKGRKEAFDKIRDLDNEYRVMSFSDDEKELEALKQKFIDFRKILEEENEKIIEYNKKHKVKIELLDISAVDPIERRATDDTKYRQETKKLQNSLNEQKTLYTDYEQYKNQTSEEQADKRYAKDLNKVKSYYKGLTDQINSLQAKKEDGTITGTESERLKMLLEQLKDFNKSKQGEEDRFFLESYNATRTRSEKLLDIDRKYKKIFAAQEAEMTEEKKELLRNQRQDEIDELNENEARKNRILLKVAKQQLVITTAGIKAQIQVIKSLLKRDDLAPEFRADLEKSLVSAETTAKLGARSAMIAQLQKSYKVYADTLILLKKSGATPEDVKIFNDKLRETQEQIDGLNKEGFTDMLDMLRNIGDEVGKLGDMLSNLGDAFGSDLLSSAGGFITGLASGIDKLSVAFDTNASKSQKVAAGIGAAVDLISMVGNAAAERKRQEEEYYRSVIDMQRQYNMSLNDQLRLQSQIGESIYVKDYVGRMKDGMIAAEDAIKNYKTAITDLANNGKITKGLGNAVDWKNVGSGVASGAALGGLIGSAVPVIGNVVGAVVGGIVGGIVGLFGGKKKKPKYEDLYQNMPAELRNKLLSSEPQDLTDVKQLLQSLNNDKAVDANTKQMIEGVLQWIEKIEEARAQIKEVVQELSGSLGSDMRNNLVEYFKQGESAAKAMGKTVNKVLEDMMSQLLFSKAFDEIFKSFEDKLTDTLLFGDEESVIDVFADFLKDAGAAGDNFYKWMDAAKQAAEKEGLDIFKPSESSSTTSGIGERISEQTGIEWIGIGRAHLDVSKQIQLIMQKVLDFDSRSYDALIRQLKHSAAIEQNTGDTVLELKEIARKLDNIEDNTKQGYYGS